MSDTTTFHIKTVAPIHIGCDEAYEPMGFIVDEAKHVLRAFDALDFIRSLGPSDKTRFSAICAKGTLESLLELYKFMRDKPMQGRKVALCRSFVGHYQETLNLPAHDRRKIQQELNNFAVARTAFNPYTGVPYIPGSSIKGALRTAWLNGVQRQRPVSKNDRRRGKELEKELLDGGEFATDPLRMVKVSDFMPVGNVRTRIVYAVNEKKKLSKFGAKGPYQILEVIEPGSFFEGTITVNDPPSRDLIRNPIERQALLNSATRFYGDELRSENDDLERINILGVLTETPSGGFLLRVGRHSGAESVTIDGHRSIRVMQGKDKPAINLDHATTFWLAAEERKPETRNLLPFGWAVVVPGSSPDECHDETFNEPDTVDQPEISPSSAPERIQAAKEVWEDALLTWSPGDKRLTAALAGQKAFCTGLESVPEARRAKLQKDKKLAHAKVVVERLGNELKIVAVEF